MAEPDVTQIIAGPGKLYVAPLGTATPIDTLPVPAIPISWAGWTPVGYTDDGVDFQYTPNIKDIMVDEEAAAVAQILIGEKAVVSVKMAEVTLKNLSRAIAACTYTDNSGGADKDIEVVIGSLPLQYLMVGVEGPAPGTGLTRVIIVPKAVAKGAVSMKIQRKDKVVFPVTFETLKLSGSVLARIVDITGHA